MTDSAERGKMSDEEIEVLREFMERPNATPLARQILRLLATLDAAREALADERHRLYGKIRMLNLRRIEEQNRALAAEQDAERLSGLLKEVLNEGPSVGLLDRIDAALAPKAPGAPGRGEESP